jgi:excisionase family DNA binding protein
MRQQPTRTFLDGGGEAVERRALTEDEILTSEEARRLLKIGRTKLWDLTKKSRIPAYRVGEGRTSGLRYKRSELLRWLDNNRI